MLDILGGRYGTCDGASRRSFLRVGMLGAFGLALPDLLRARAAAAARAKDTAVIQIFLGGGPTHIDTYDLKPNAPKEFRGEFKPIATNVPGIELCELFPQQAKVADKLAVIRSLHHTTSDHNVGSHWVMTGFSSAPQAQRNERPSAGSIVARLRGANKPGIPSYVAVPNAPPFSQAAYLGPGYNPFGLNGNPVNDVKVRNLDLPGGLTLDRLDDRRYLLGKLDKINRQRDASGAMEGMDRFTAEAYEMITGPNARKAFDLSQEDPKARDRYGRTQVGQGCLLARRLVEAGVSFVTVSEGNWDHHGQVFQNCRRQLPPLDTAIAALVTDLYERGLADRVLLLVWGEFGRTPRVNGGSGRDHWPGSMSALVSGGGLKMGQVIGATNSKAEYPTERALRPEDMLRTVYQVLDIDPRHAFLNDSGRPMPVLNQGEPIRELV
ncbi:MAG: DUF1501 domain-containing protein [Isosphaeraceae bacterium]|nr:DUF1501 domain-containing protein [Isosphaeraceae bacterium]